MTLRYSPDELVHESSNPLLDTHESWARVKLGDIADILNGAAFKSDYFTKGGSGLPLLRIRDVGQNKTDAFYTGEFNDRYLVEPGSLVVGMDGDFRIARWDGPTALLNQRVCKLTVQHPEHFDDRFLLYVLPGYLDEIHSKTSAVTVKHLSSRTLQDLPLPLPPLAEQHRIVEAIEEQFSRLDAADRLLDKVQLRLGQLSSAAVLDLFDGDWEWSALGDIAEIAGGVTKDSKRQGDPAFVEVPYLRVANVQRGHLDLSEVTTIRVPPAKAEALELQVGDVLF
ncbi:MAG: restriction endonuclease subunit S, partial [Acidimicrobiia bacterium]|nr:restriction endonuclease subunit S [Acidimicrobiia bacterium]